MKKTLGIFLTTAATVLAGSLDQPHSLSTRADVIAEAYEANVIAADARYRGRQLSLGGKIKEINVNEDVGVPMSFSTEATQIGHQVRLLSRRWGAAN